MTLNLLIWRQKDVDSPGKMVPYTISNASPDMSFLEMLDVLNEDLINKGEDAVEFDNDCREGICGMCGLVINGVAHGPKRATAACQVHMREFEDGETITIEPWRAKAFPVIKDLVVDRSAFDRIMAAGGYISVNVGEGARCKHVGRYLKLTLTKQWTQLCVLVAGRVSQRVRTHLRRCSWGRELRNSHYCHKGNLRENGGRSIWSNRWTRKALETVPTIAECEAVCPKEISISNIAAMRREYLKAVLS